MVYELHINGFHFGIYDTLADAWEAYSSQRLEEEMYFADDETVRNYLANQAKDSLQAIAELASELSEEASVTIHLNQD